MFPTEPIMTRILSAFNLLKRVGFAVLVMAGTVHAQQLSLIWQKRGEGPQSRFGGTIFGLGDRNHDGYDDFAVYAWGSGEAGNPSEPMLELFYGGNPPSTQPFYIFRGIVDEGLTLAGAYEIGDINGDGLMDWVIRYRTGSFAQQWTYVYIGVTEFPCEPTWIIPYVNPDWDLEVTPGMIGDVNGDGYDEIFLTALGCQGGEPCRGIMWFGSAEPDSIADWEIQSMDGWYVWPSNRANEDGVGDINGDGYDDILNRRYRDNGPFLVFWGGEEPSAIPDTIGFNPYSNYPAFHIVGDLNGDGRDDIADAISLNQSAVFLGGETLSSQADYILNNSSCDPSGGTWKLDGVGDLNGDGHQEIALSDYFCPSGSGTIWLYFNFNWINTNPRFTFHGSQFGTSGLREAARIGDVNGDGVDDMGIGGLNDVDFRGWAGILAGNPNIVVRADDAPAPVVEELELSVYPNPFNSTLRISLDVPLYADVSVTLYDLLGREVDTIHRGRLTAITLSYAAPASLASGVYFIRAATAIQSHMQKVVLLK
jgi:hypothetical protein